MAYRNRTINPSLWDDEDFLELELPAQMLWIGLISHADDGGRLHAGPRSLRAKALRSHDFSVEQVCLWRDELVRRGMVCLYEVDGSSFLHLPKWRRYQYVNRPAPSVIPPCPRCEAALLAASDPAAQVPPSRSLVPPFPLGAVPNRKRATAPPRPQAETSPRQRAAGVCTPALELPSTPVLPQIGVSEPDATLPAPESRRHGRPAAEGAPLGTTPRQGVDREWLTIERSPEGPDTSEPDDGASDNVEQDSLVGHGDATASLAPAAVSEAVASSRQVAAAYDILTAGGTDAGALALLGEWADNNDPMFLLDTLHTCLDVAGAGLDWQYGMRKALLKPSRSVAYLVAAARGRASDLAQRNAMGWATGQIRPGQWALPLGSVSLDVATSHDESAGRPGVVPHDVAHGHPALAPAGDFIAARAKPECGVPYRSSRDVGRGPTAPSPGATPGSQRPIYNKYTSGKYGHLVHCYSPGLSTSR